MKKKFLNKGYILLFSCWMLIICLPLINYASDINLEEQAKITEQKLKIGIIYKLAKFITWPNITNTDTKPLAICTLGTDPLIDYFPPLQNKKVNAQPILVRAVSHEQSVDNCNILFIAESEEPRLEKILLSLTFPSAVEKEENKKAKTPKIVAKPILTISTIPDFSQEKGMITLKLVEGNVRFDINILNIHKAGLNADGQLFNLADDVFPK